MEETGVKERPSEIRVREAAQLDAVRELGIEHARYPLHGNGTGNVENYAKAVERLARAAEGGETTLVHCEFGSQRTGGVVAAYRVLVEGKTPDEAMREMRRYDWHPRKHFSVTDYLNENLPEIADWLAGKK